MNNLMTNSFLSYVELKKQALKDLGATDLDLEAGGLTTAEEENLTQFFEEVEAIQTVIGEISGLLTDLQQLSNETRSTHSAKVLRGLRDRMDSDMVDILKKAKIIKARLGALDGSNASNRRLSQVYREGSSVDRTRISVTNGLRSKLRDMMNEFQCLRDRIVADHKEHLKRKYFIATGEVATEEMTEKICLEGDKKLQLDIEGQERQKAVTELQRSLTRLHQVFLDMAIIIEAQQEPLNDIEKNVINAREYISGGTNRLVSAKALKKRNARWVQWVWILIVILLLVCLIPIFTGS